MTGLVLISNAHVRLQDKYSKVSNPIINHNHRERERKKGANNIIRHTSSSNFQKKVERERKRGEMIQLSILNYRLLQIIIAEERRASSWIFRFISLMLYKVSAITLSLDKYLIIRERKENY